MNNKSGFTLLEIIIVIIIVGVLASLALPRFFQTINFSRSTEALNAIRVIKQAMDHCAIMAGAGDAPRYLTCSTFPSIGIEDPGAAPGAHFSYALAVGAGLLRITATPTVGNGVGDIEVTYITESGAVQKYGTGDFSGIR